MAKIVIGSARSDERGNLSGGKAGDQKQRSMPDLSGEVSMQNFYVHKKGWYILRAKDPKHGEKLAESMKRACNNPNIGYDQGQRTNILKHGTGATVKTECDCSALVRMCVIEACGKDPGNFTTSTETTILEASGLFGKRIAYKTGTALYDGDVLVTKTKGHTVIVVEGKKRIQQNAEYYPIYAGKSNSLVDALISVGVDASKDNRTKIAKANGIDHYSGSATDNLMLLALLKSGKLKKLQKTD